MTAMRKSRTSPRGTTVCHTLLLPSFRDLRSSL